MSDVSRLYDDEVKIDSALVARLLVEQFPEWAEAPIRGVAASGTDNVTFRVGADLAVRLPRTEGSQDQVRKDATWLPRLAPHLPLAVPEPLGLGTPGQGYPFNWGVYRWLAGEPFQHDQLADPVAAARGLAEFVRCLQTVDPTGAPLPPDSPFSRGTPLAPRDGLFREALDELRDEFDTGLVLAAWEAALAADVWDGTRRWIHGDLMAGNVLVSGGKPSAVIDFGTAWAADPAGDLLAAWYLFEGDSRHAFRDAMAVDDAAWVRARGWVLSMELIVIPYLRARDPDAEPDTDHSFIEGILAEFAAEL
ncbi:aminoglycoside phosphotransferase family protein [Microlunatus speluncae]|uniref:aminoglycoside phosphotransferase family protein n=1 Tax=Microlunatus speluncae TaxID=2594267 RepID=UPI0012661CB3|nr:aminoglycoside phosphotransferase family protein [Microlunatus speluncae]